MRSNEHIHFVTGRLAAHALAPIVERLAAEIGFAHTIQVMPITVAALMSTDWIAERIDIPSDTSKVVVPGYVNGDLAGIELRAGVPVERGPRDLQRLPDHFGRPAPPTNYGSYDIEIIAEINHCPRLTLDEILHQAARLRGDGADVIDVGCDPGPAWTGVGDVVRALSREGYRVSIDSMNPLEIEPAVKAGAELVLSVDSSNRDAAVDWGVEVVVVPDDPKAIDQLDDTVEFLARHNVPLRIDPVIEPISFGFAASLGRFLAVRSRYPDAEMLMGVGNLTELTDVDSVGVNAMLLGFCQELSIRSVLTTQVIPWAQSSVKECDLARRLMHHAVHQRVLPKHLEPRLILLRDHAVSEMPGDQFEHLADTIKDHNYRIFVAAGELHVVSSGLHLHDTDPFVLIDKLRTTNPTNLDAGHAFYLGFELHKALTALTLGKQYEQDEPLDWGFLTRSERHHYLTKGKEKL